MVYHGLDDRKRRILKAIIDDYVNTAEPVGSRTIAKKHELGFSSATIRNEMADLEDMGYLAQPHTSSGRIPSDKGYRLYVDQLMNLRELTLLEMDSMKESMEVKMHELGQLIKQASVALSRMTKYTSVAMTPQMNKTIVKAIQLVPIDQGKILVVVVTGAGIVRNTLIRISEDILPEFLHRTAAILNEKLSGLSIEQINLSVIKDIEKEMGESKEILIPILDEVAQCINQIDCQEAILEGATNIFNHPEFMNVIRAKEFLDVMEEKQVLFKILTGSGVEDKNLIHIQIGCENDIEAIQDLTLIKTTYNIGDNIIGAIGIIGPTRMEYAKVIATMEYIRKKIDEEIKRLFYNKMDQK